MNIGDGLKQIINYMNDYCIHCGVHHNDRPTSHISYELKQSNLTDEGINDLIRVFESFEETIPELYFWITKTDEDQNEIILHKPIQSENSETN